MNQPATYTGRKKHTTTHATVLLSDKIARLIITLGGLATIAAVLLVGVFLFVVAMPLFQSASTNSSNLFHSNYQVIRYLLLALMNLVL